MTAAATIEIAAPAGSGSNPAPGPPQASTARQSPRAEWAAAFRSASAEEVSPRTERDLQAVTQAIDSPASDPSGFARQNAEPAAQLASATQSAGANASAGPPPERLEVEKESVEGFAAKNNPPARPSIPAPGLVASDGSLHPADPPASAKRAGAGAGESERAAGDAKKLHPSSPAPNLTTLAMAVPFVSALSLSPVPVATVKSSAPPSHRVLKAESSVSSLSEIQIANSFPRASSARAVPISENGAGVRGVDAASTSAPRTEEAPIAHGVAGAQANQISPPAAGDVEITAVTDEDSSNGSAGPIPAQEVPAAKPLVRGAGSSTAPRDEGVAASAVASTNPGEAKTLPAPSEQADVSSPMALNDSVSAQESAGREISAKAKPHAPSEGIVIGATTPAAHPATVLGSLSSQSVSFVAREPGSGPVSAQAPAHFGIVPPGSSHDPFAALDDVGSSVAPTWLHAGAARAEAGFEDPALGWVGVRAELGTSGVHASLVPGSTDAAQALGSHLAGLNAYLAAHHAEIPAVTMSAPESRSADQGLGHGGAGTAQQGFREQTQQGSGSERGSSPQAGAREPAAIGSMAAASPAAATVGAIEMQGAFWMESGAGSHIYVVA
jgi:hypothetical protein